MGDETEPEAHLLTPPHNFAIVKLRDRAFPGIHFQADSTSIILNEIRDIKKLMGEGDFTEADYLVDQLMEQFFELLKYYERVATENGYEVPYWQDPKSEIEKEALYRLGEYAKLPKGTMIPTHLQNWAKIIKYVPEIPLVKLVLSENGGLNGKVKYWAAKDLPSSDELQLCPSKLHIETSSEEICLFDRSLHGWDAANGEALEHQANDETSISCAKCESVEFTSNIELGYLAFGEDEPKQMFTLAARDSFESIEFNFTCMACGEIDYRFAPICCDRRIY